MMKNKNGASETDNRISKQAEIMIQRKEQYIVSNCKEVSYMYENEP